MKKAHIISGSPGSGKTTYGRKLAESNCLIFLDIDTVTGRLVEIALCEGGHSSSDRDSAYFKATFREPIYQTLFDIARENLGWTDVVIAGPFTRELRDVDWPAKLRKLLSAQIEVHYLYCDPLERKRRLEQRKHPRDVAKLNDWKVSTSYYGDESPPVFPHVFVDTTK